MKPRKVNYRRFKRSKARGGEDCADDSCCRCSRICLCFFPISYPYDLSPNDNKKTFIFASLPSPRFLLTSSAFLFILFHLIIYIPIWSLTCIGFNAFFSPSPNGFDYFMVSFFLYSLNYTKISAPFLVPNGSFVDLSCICGILNSS